MRGLVLAKNKDDIAATVLKTTEPSGIHVIVGDVAEVNPAPKVRLGVITRDGEGETIVGIAKMEYGLKASDVLPALKAKMAAAQKLPAGVEMPIFYDRSDLRAALDRQMAPQKGQTLPIRRPSASTIAPPRQAVVHWFEQVAAAKEKLQARAIER